MTSKLSLGQQVLQLAREVAAGTASAPDLYPLLDSLSGDVKNAAAQFEENAVGNPEIDPTTVDLVLGAFQSYQKELAKLRLAAESADTAAITAATDAIARAIETISTSLNGYQEAMQNWNPTPWRYLNRVVMHFTYFITDGHETRHTVTLLKDLPAFLQEMKRDIGTVESPRDQQQAVTALQKIETACGTLLSSLPALAKTDGVKRGAALEPVRNSLLEASGMLAAALGVQVQRELSLGPTGVMVVNGVLRAADKFARGEMDAATFAAVVKRCHDGLNAFLPLNPDPLVIDAAEAVKVELERIETADRQTEALQNAIDSLTSAAHNLAMYVSASSMPEWEHEESILDMMTDGEVRPTVTQPSTMPPLLESLMRVGNDYLSSGRKDLILKGLEMLDSSVSRFTDRAARLAEDDPGKPILQQSIDYLRDASGSMRELLKTRDPRALEAAEWLMRRACEGLARV